MNVHDATKAFTRKLGATEDNSGDHIYFYLSFEGSDYTVGKLSHSWTGSLNDTQINMLAHKLHLKKHEFEQFVGCRLTTPDMINLWQQRRQTL